MFFGPHCTILKYYEHLNLTFILNINITTKQGVPKKWCTFENAVIRNGKQLETCFFARLR